MCAIWSAGVRRIRCRNASTASNSLESPGALLRFLNTLGTHWNISLFHYRSHGTDYGRVLAAFELGDHEPDFETRLNELGYDCHDETNNPAFRFFWRVSGSAKSSRTPSISGSCSRFFLTHAQFKRRFHHCALKSSRGYALVPGCFPAPLPATRPRHSRALPSIPSLHARRPWRKSSGC